MKIENAERCEFYTRECVSSDWSVRQLERQINSFFYERLLATQKSGRDSVKNEIQTLEPKTDPEYILKDPFILEFLDLCENRIEISKQIQKNYLRP
jgi:predicted nuclease of restriction endonuclease-like (RecB) superfamily